jgi:hypothetical protein
VDSSAFDHLTRLCAHARSRRALGGAVLGVVAGRFGFSEAEAVRCPPGKKRCGARCIRKRACCLRTQKRCGGRCIPKGACCTVTHKRCGITCIPKASCCTQADCGPLRLCAKGTCVIGQGTCELGADTCQGVLRPCTSAIAACSCYRTTLGETRCGNDIILPPGENGCVNDLDCAARYPSIPGVFCTKGTATGPVGCTAANYCQSSCPG